MHLQETTETNVHQTWRCRLLRREGRGRGKGNAKAGGTGYSVPMTSWRGCYCTEEGRDMGGEEDSSLNQGIIVRNERESYSSSWKQILAMNWIELNGVYTVQCRMGMDVTALCRTHTLSYDRLVRLTRQTNCKRQKNCKVKVEIGLEKDWRRQVVPDTWYLVTSIRSKKVKGEGEKEKVGDSGLWFALISRSDLASSNEDQDGLMVGRGSVEGMAVGEKVK